MSIVRSGVNHIGVAVIYFCHDGGGSFLMALRNVNARDEHDRWDIGGGALEFGESVIETLKREIKEEYSTDVLSYEFLGYRDVHRVHAGKQTHWITLDFKVLVDPKKVKNGEPEKFDEVRWFTFDRLPEPLHSQIPNFVRIYKDRLS